MVVRVFDFFSGGGCFSTADDTAAADVFPPPATLNVPALLLAPPEMLLSVLCRTFVLL